MNESTTLLIAIILGALYFCSMIILPPRSFPKNIPTVPFYVSFLSTYTSMDQVDIYEKYFRPGLEEYGAVKTYFACRWNILVSKPQLLQQVFREEVFSKSGNHIKIPYSILAEYTGDNIISAHGDVWRLYRKILTAPIQFPKQDHLKANSQKLIEQIKERITKNGNKLFIGDLIQRISLENVGQSMFGIKFGAIESGNVEMTTKLTKVKSEIFKPLFMNFPVLDKLPIPSRAPARKTVRDFREYFSNMVMRAPDAKLNEPTVSSNLVSSLKEKLITEKQFTDNAMIVMIAGHENPQLLLNSLIYFIAKNKQVQDKVRNELASYQNPDEHFYLASVIYESLRMLPPLAQIINRKTTQKVVLGDNIVIPKGTYVGYNNLATGRDREVWEDADTFRPERWGHSSEEVTRNYTHAKISAKLPAFHGRKRACLGEKFALNETKQIVTEIIKNYNVSLDPNWRETMTPSGPLCPKAMKLVFREL